MNRILATALTALCLSTLVAAPRSATAQLIELPGTQPGDLDGQEPMATPIGCSSSCHSLNDATMDTAMPYDHWVGSMMANAMRDPLFLAALTVAEQDRPQVGDWCLRCHTPPGFVGGRTRSTDPGVRAGLGTQLTPADLEGITCDSCHRMTETPNPSNAQYVISPDTTRFGPYDDAVSMRHAAERSAWLADSRMCATCHEITNPTQPQRTADGTDTGRRFPLDSTYSEWAQSSFANPADPMARTCQDCHMPRNGGPGFNSSAVTAMERPNPRRHDLVGANAWAIRVLGTMRGDMALTDFYNPDLAPYYARAAERAEAMLRSSATLQIQSAPERVEAGGQVELVVRITNNAGHRLPSGYADGRRVWLEVDLLDADNNATPVSGHYDAYEAHLDEADPQLRIYEAFHGRAGMGRGEHIALHDTVVKDTRLPPRGFRPAPGHEPVGANYAGGENGALRHWDDARYTFAVPPTARGPYTVRVRARYQSTTREYVEFLARENRTDSRGMDLLRRFEASGRAAPTDIATATAQIAQIPSAADAGASGDAGVGDSGSADGGTMMRPTGCGCRTAGSTSARSAWWLLGLVVAVVVRRRSKAP